ncbi:MAG: YbhN family protein [Bdellovibrionales bacterium]
MNLSKIKTFVKYALSITLLMFLFVQMDLSLLIGQALELNVFLMAAAIILIVAQIVFLNVRWHLLMNVGGRGISFEVSSLINVASQLANIFFITSIGGIVTKSALAVRYGLSWTQSVFATFLDRFMTLAALIVLSTLGLPFLISAVDDKLLIMLALTVSFVILSVVFFVMILRSGAIKNVIFTNRRRAYFVAILRTYSKQRAIMLKSGLISIAAQICFILSVYVLSLGFDGTTQNGQVIEFLALIPVIALISSLPISFGGWGVREGAFVYGLALIGFPMEVAFLLSVQVGLVTLIAPFLAGAPYLLSARGREIFKAKPKQSV